MLWIKRHHRNREEDNVSIQGSGRKKKDEEQPTLSKTERDRAPS
jgi:hypothetical protein